MSRFNSRYSRHGSLPQLSEHEVGHPRKMRLRNPIVAGELEYLVQPVYDWYSVAVATALAKQTMFTIPIGQSYTGTGVAAITKSLYNTNLVQAGMLDAPKKLLVKALALVLRSDVSPQDANRFLGDTLVQFFVSGKDYWTSLASKIPAGGGAFFFGNAGGALAAVGNVASNGWPSAENVATITDPMPQIPGLRDMQPILGQLIEQQQNFSVVVDPTITGVAAFTTLAAAPATIFPGTGINAHVYLEGVLARAVL